VQTLKDIGVRKKGGEAPPPPFSMEGKLNDLINVCKIAIYEPGNLELPRYRPKL
jgi:hypothetical protein